MAEPPAKRFRYATYNEKLRDISVDKGRSKGLSWEKDVYDEDTKQTSTPFTAELSRLSIHDLTLPYQTLARTLAPLSTSLPITLLNLPTIIRIFSEYYATLKDGSDHLNSGLESALSLHNALFATCLSEATAYLPVTARDLIRVGALRALEPKLIEKAFSILSEVLRLLASSLVKPDEVAQATLRATWEEVTPYLRVKENKQYVRKCVSDAWIGVLRKVRGDGLERLMAVLLEEQAEGMEAVWAGSMKGTSGQLHSRALPLFEILLRRTMEKPDDGRLQTVEMVLISLAHYCSAATLAPITTSIVQSFQQSVGQSGTEAVSDQTTLLNLAAAVMFTRRGKRFVEGQIKPTMSVLVDMSALLEERRSGDGEAKEWTDAYVKAVVAALMAGKLEHWLSPGVVLIDKACKGMSTEQFFALVNGLVKLKWAGVEQFLLTHVAKTALPALETSPLAALTLLNNLSSAGFLSGGLSNVQGGRWRKTLLSSVSNLLDRLVTSTNVTESRRQLGQILRLIPALNDGTSFTPALMRLLQGCVDTATKKGPAGLQKDWEEKGVWNEAHMAANVLRCITDLAPMYDELCAPVQEMLLDKEGMQVLVDGYAWSREVLEQLATLADQWSADKRLLTLNTTVILHNLISADSGLRASTLRLLSLTSAPAPSAESDELTPVTPHSIWEHCRTIESSEMTLRNIRDRTAQIARLGRLLQSVPKDANVGLLSATNHAIRYLLSQLKVNYRPIYPEAIKALEALTPQHGETIWESVWGELEKTHAAGVFAVPDLETDSPAWTAQVTGKADKGKQESEEEAEFRCTAMDKMVKVFKKEWAGAEDLSVLDAAEISITSDRLDVLNYEAQLVAFLAAVPLLAEKHTRSIVPMFFAVSGYEASSTGDRPTLSTRQLQSRTATFLELFTKFVNPKAAFRSDELRTIYLDILAKGDNRLQKLSLECLLTFKSPSLVNYAESLRTLLEESKFRDELTHFSLEQDSGVIEPSHRPEAVAVTIRLLYGIITARRGRTSAHGLQGRKQAILTALSGCSPDELQTLVDLMLEPFAKVEGQSKGDAPGRQQLGFMSLLHDVLRYLGPQIADHWPVLLGTTIDLVAAAQSKIDAEVLDAVQVEDQDQVPEEEEAEEEVAEETTGSAPLRSIRTAGIKRIVEFVRSRVEYDFTPYLHRIFAAVISPRLDKLDVENTQAPSGVLDLIAALAVSPKTAPSLSEMDARTLPQTFACLVAPKVKPSVIGRVFDVVDSLLGIDDQEILSAHIDTLLDRIIQLVPALKQGQGQDDLLRRLLAILSQLSVIVTDGPQAQTLASLLGPMLRQSNKQFPEKAKLNILLTLQRSYAISPDFAHPTSTFFGQSFELISNLLQTLFFPSSRRALIGVLDTFAVVDDTLKESIRITGDLNAYSARRMDEPDFAKRLDAFGEVNDGQVVFTTRRQWLPLLRSALFFIRDPEELSIRTNASALLQRFINTVGPAAEGELADVLIYLLVPGLKQALKSKLEMVRNEILAVFSHAVKTCTGVPVLIDLQPVLGQDEEQDFFTNMAHIQVHRRARAIHRLRDLVADGKISESATSTIFLPLLEHVITGATDVSDHHLVNESITTIGALSSVMRWSRYNALLTRYLRLGSSKSAQQKFYIRSVSAIIDNFHFDLSPSTIVEEQAVVEEAEDDVVVEAEVVAPTQSARITEVVLGKLLPSLTRFVEQKDETEDNIRIPVALGIVKIAHALPTESSAVEVLRIITTTAQILRSKDQDTRDLARETVCKIAIYLGPDWLVRVIKELRDALQRGPQKHVLAVTVHAILVKATEDDRFSNLDTAVQDAVEISAEVVWGESGKDVETEGFKSKMREVKGASSRGYDTFQLVSRLASPGKIATILGPVRDVMHASQAVKTMLHVDEALRRITLGLNANAQLGPEDLLSLCYSLIGGNSSYLKVKAKLKHKSAKGSTANVGDRFIVQMKRDPGKEEDFYPLNAHKFVVFGLDLFVTAFRRGRFDFDNADILSRLGPLVGAIGNTLYSSHETVLSLGLKATAAVARCPLPQLEDALPVYVTNIMKVIKSAGGTTESDLVQTAFKALAVIIRDCKSSTLTDGQLKYILECIAPDMEESDRQSAIFAILRAIVSRKFVVPEIYDLMDRVSSIMVTSQSTNVQEQCRGVLMAFLLDYPQGQGRLKAQMTFLAQNLSYVYETGRVSVMELLSAVFGKFSEAIVEEYCDLFFVALVMVLANDDSEKCRGMASVLIKLLLECVGEGSQFRIVGILNGWIKERAQNRVLAGAALNVLASLIGSQVDVRDSAVKAVLPIIIESAAQLGDAEVEQSAFAERLDHIVPHQALAGLGKILLLDDFVLDDEEELPLDDIIAHLLFPHDWVRFDTTRILSTLFIKDEGKGVAEFTDQQLLDTARKACVVLKGGRDADGEETVVDPKLADEVVKLLWNIAKHWAAKEAAGELNITAAAPDADADAELDTEVNCEKSISKKAQNPLSWLMSRASFLARQLIVNRPASHIPYLSTQWTRPVMSILRFFAGSIQAMDETLARRYAKHVLNPVYRILDEGGELAVVKDGDEGLVELKQLATEVRDFLQSSIGTTDFSHVWENIRKTTRERREGRREARVQLAVQNPQAFAQRKEKRGEMKKESKKRKIKSFADQKMRERPMKKRG